MSIRDEIAINVVDVVQHYGIRPVLRGVNLHVQKGEVVALMGPNGSGKSSLMGVMAGMVAPVRGYVEIDGKRRRSSQEAELAIRKQVVYLPCEPWLPALRTGREWLLAVGGLYDIDSERLMDHIERLLAVFDLKAQADGPISGYSTGQKKKIAICCALATEAPVMLLDEAFSGGLDPSGILALKHILLRYAQRDDITIVMATPVPELVEELADRVVVIRDGQIAANDSVAALRTKTGCAGGLAEVYGKLVSPETLRNIERYFEEVRP